MGRIFLGTLEKLLAYRLDEIKSKVEGQLAYLEESTNLCSSAQNYCFSEFLREDLVTKTGGSTVTSVIIVRS